MMKGTSSADVLLSELKRIFRDNSLFEFGLWLKRQNEMNGQEFVGWVYTRQGPVALWLTNQLKHRLLDCVLTEENGVCVTYYVPLKELRNSSWVVRFDKALKDRFSESQGVAASEALEIFEKVFVTK